MRRKAIIAFALVSLLAGVLPTRAEMLDSALIDALVQGRLANNGPPGFALAILVGDGPPRVHSYGIAELEQAVAVSARSIFPIASITKTFTAIAIMLLQQEGKLSTADPVSRYLQDFPNGDRIMLRDLLVHTSGIAEFTRLEPFSSDQAHDWTPQQLIDMVKAAPPLTPPRTACAYNDSGYILLGRVIEKVSGQPFAAFVRERIAVPLAMPSVDAGSRHRLTPHRVAGYARVGEAWQNAPAASLDAPWSAGGMVASAGDLVRLAFALRPNGPLLRPESYAEMLAKVVLQDGRPCRLDLPGAKATYGYGLEIVRFDDLPEHRAIGKSGVFPGYSSYFAAFEGAGLALAAFADADDSLAFTVETVHEVAKLLLAEQR